MKTPRPEQELERLLTALEQELLDATDEEILAVAHELGMNPGMKGSIALLGVTFTIPRNNHSAPAQRPIEVTPGPGSPARSRRRPKGNTPSSS